LRDLSLHLLDLLGNSVKARAHHVSTRLSVDLRTDFLSVAIEDDGCGMDKALLDTVTDPFTTTRTTRSVGLGIPLFKEAAESAGGRFHIDSELGRGTVLSGTFRIGHIDRLPLGDLGATFSVLVRSDPGMDFALELSADGRGYRFSTEEVREALEGAALDEPDVLAWIEASIAEGQREVFHGILPEIGTGEPEGAEGA
jgi:hypothetical protein